jgi:hypothetical protein
MKLPRRITFGTNTRYPSFLPSRTIGAIRLLLVLAVFWTGLFQSPVAFASDFFLPWRNPERALVLDAYEYNSLDWHKIVQDRRIVGFIGKASDGLPPEYCTFADKGICGVSWRKYSVSRELYHTRRQLARALGLKWGAYHLGRRGNPEEQADHFISYADPRPDEVIVLDLEMPEHEVFMTLEEAERFVARIHQRLERYPLLYANHRTAIAIADNRDAYPLLSRLKLWYARYKPGISGVFPVGNWESYALWQFAYGGNCRKDCPYRVDGTPRDIDVNVLPMTVEEARLAWPFNGLLPVRTIEPEEPENFPDPVYVNTESAVDAVTANGSTGHSDFVAEPDYNPSQATQTPPAGGGRPAASARLAQGPVVPTENPVRVEERMKREREACVRTGYRDGENGPISC